MNTDDAPNGGLRLLTIPHAAERLAISRSTVYNLISAGALRAVNVSVEAGHAKTRIRVDDLDAFIEGRTRSARRLCRR